MRLSKIKLAGFKSFVDPTTIPLPSNLIGVVGPNGCGKSNVIDAVRWVMGESSAKNLRGDSMADVIFNGSSSRKPVGQAFIELVFDNSDGTIGGQYAAYSEISIKRVVTRDGQSQYFQNGAKCRRKDITDIFLGTGLGPRSYSIIEQGMISRLIEAKPEDLRVFLEEAAGVDDRTGHRAEHESETLRRGDRRGQLGEKGFWYYSVGRSPVKPVRETSSSIPPNLRVHTSNGRSVSTPARPACISASRVSGTVASEPSWRSARMALTTVSGFSLARYLWR